MLNILFTSSFTHSLILFFICSNGNSEYFTFDSHDLIYHWKIEKLGRFFLDLSYVTFL